jgi:Skp family chaperone for outer membrane proteins
MDEKKRAVDAESTALMTLINETQRGLKAKREFLQSAASKIVRAAIEEVANEGGYHYVLDGGQRPILFSAESLDITDEVLKKIMKDQ